MPLTIVALSDTHGRHLQVKVPDGDILICAGDCTYNIGKASLREFLIWFQGHPHKHKLLIAGNHDGAFQKWPKDARQLVAHFAPGVTYLQDEMIEIEGIKFYGTPWTPTFYDWYFMADRGPAILEHWNKIPKDVNVLITHGPPHGILDMTDRDGHQGCRDLTEIIKTLPNLKVHVFGHFYSQYGIKMTDSVYYINGAICNEAYQPVNKPIVIPIESTKCH